MKIIEICQELTKEIPSEQIYMNEPMAKHTTFKVGGNADIFVMVKNIMQLKYIIKVAKKNNEKVYFIGNGSNILVKDNGIRGIVAKIDFETIQYEEIEDSKKDNEGKEVIVTIGAGVKLMALAQELLRKGIAGFEFASGIPGTMGGAIKMNAGAHGGEMKDIVISTKCLDLKRYYLIEEKKYIDDIEITENIEKSDEPEIIELSNQEQEFEYRNSIFLNRRYVILETKLKLKYGNKQEIEEKMQEFLKKRKSTQPNQPSAGSTFKRGNDFITAKLIDECGLKGYRIGDAMVSEKHAGFVVNTGNATAKEILELITYIKEKVFEKTGKNIELEVEILGE